MSRAVFLSHTIFACPPPPPGGRRHFLKEYILSAERYYVYSRIKGPKTSTNLKLLSRHRSPMDSMSVVVRRSSSVDGCCENILAGVKVKICKIRHFERFFCKTAAQRVPVRVRVISYR